MLLRCYGLVLYSELLAQDLRVLAFVFFPRLPTAAMSRVPLVGPCSVCGAPNPKHRKCEKCGNPYCSKECQKADWKEHKKCCEPTYRGINFATDDDFTAGRRKATRYLEMFEAQMALRATGHAAAPFCSVVTHPDLQRVMSHAWLASMEAWQDGATAELMEGTAGFKIRFTVTRIGSVLTEAVLNGKNTRLFLHLPDKNKMSEWTIVMEPLATGSADEAF